MKRVLVITAAAALILSGAAVVWPRAAPAPDGAAPSPPGGPPVSAFAKVEISADPQGGLTLQGLVKDDAGRPVPDAEVFAAATAQASLSTVRCAEGEALLLSCPSPVTAARVVQYLRAGHAAIAAGASTRTDAKGAFRFEHLRGVSFTVWARAKGLGEGVQERAAPGETVDLFLPALRRISGTLEDERGHAIEGGTVYAISRRIALPHQATSGKGGAFSLDSLGEGPFYVVAEAPGFLPVAKLQVEARSEPLTLALMLPRRLEVSVRHQGKPAAALVRLSGEHLVREGQAKEGGLAFDGLFPGEVVVTASVGSASAMPRTVSLSEAVTRVSLDLEEGGTVSVTAVDDAGMPVPNPELTLFTASGTRVSSKKLRTGELALFGPLGPGPYLVRGTSVGFKGAELPVEVKAGDLPVELEFAKGTTLSGRVLDVYGRPAPGISILLNPTGETLLADADGRFVAEVPSPGQYELHAHHSQWGGGSVKAVAPKADIELNLEPRATVEITVTSEGRRVEGASATLWVDREGSFRSDQVSGADGQVTMRGIPPGTYAVIASHPDYLPSDRQKVTLEEGQTGRLSAELKPGAQVSGVVQDLDGRPVAGASVAIIPRRAEPTSTDASGRFSLRALRPGGVYRLDVKHAQFEQLERVEVRPPSDEVKVVVKRRPVFRGRVLSDKGEPLRRFKLDGREIESTDGRFEEAVAGQGERLLIAVEAVGHEPTMIDRPNTGPDLGDIVLRRASALVGVVRDGQGAPVADAVVGCDVCDQSVTSGPDGRFQLANPAYAAQLTLSAKKGSLSGTLAVKGGDTEREHLLTLASAVHLRGVAYLEGGRPAAGVQIEGLHVERSEPVTVVTGADGSYEVDVPAGTYRFAFDPETGGRGPAMPPAVVTELRGSQARLDFGPAPGTAQLAINLRPERGFALWIVRGALSSVANPPVELMRSSYAQLLYQPLTERVTVRGLAPGHYTLVWGSFHAETPGGPLLKAVELPASGEVSLSR